MKGKISLYDLPPNARAKILAFMGLERACPVDLAPAKPRGSWSDLQHSAVPPDCEYRDRRRGNYRCWDYGTLNKDVSCICPPLPLSLLQVSRAVRREALEVLGRRNRFVLRARALADLDALTRLPPDLVRSLRFLLVRLNVWPCGLGHDTGSYKFGPTSCAQCRGPLMEEDEAVLRSTSKDGREMVVRWEAVWGYLASHIMPGRLRLTFVCDVGDVQSAQDILAPLVRATPALELEACTIRLGRARKVANHALMDLCQATCLHLTTSPGHRPSPAPPSESSFQWERLPTELRLRILHFTHLGPGGDYAPEHRTLRIHQGRLEVGSKLGCCGACTETFRDCCCPNRRAAWASPRQASRCTCRLFPMELFLVSREMSALAAEVLYAENEFLFDDSAKATLDFLQRLPAQALPLIQRIEFVIVECMAYKEDESRHSWIQADYWRFQRGDWLELVEYIRGNLNLPNLHITLNLECIYDGEDWCFGNVGQFPHDEYRDVIVQVAGSMCGLARSEDGLSSVRFKMDEGLFGWYLEDWLAREVMGERYQGPVPRCDGWTPEKLHRPGARFEIEGSNFGGMMWLFEGMDGSESRSILKELGLEAD